MLIFANGKRRFHSFIEFFVIHLKNQEVKIWSFGSSDISVTFQATLNLYAHYINSPGALYWGSQLSGSVYSLF